MASEDVLKPAATSKARRLSKLENRPLPCRRRCVGPDIHEELFRNFSKLIIRHGKRLTRTLYDNPILRCINHIRPQTGENWASRPLCHTQAPDRWISSWVGDHQRIPTVVCFCFIFAGRHYFLGGRFTPFVVQATEEQTEAGVQDHLQTF